MYADDEQHFADFMLYTAPYHCDIKALEPTSCDSTRVSEQIKVSSLIDRLTLLANPARDFWC